MFSRLLLCRLLLLFLRPVLFLRGFRLRLLFLPALRFLRRLRGLLRLLRLPAPLNLLLNRLLRSMIIMLLLKNCCLLEEVLCVFMPTSLKPIIGTQAMERLLLFFMVLIFLII